jgi:hypothetical protein
MAEWMDKTPGPGGIPEQAHSDAIATQDSVLSTNQLHVLSLVQVGADGNNAGIFETVNADALSFFQVSFSVSSPIIFDLSFFDARDYVGGKGSTYEKAFDLTSATSGSILGVPIFVDNTAFYTGLLQPGETYTLLLSQHANTDIPDPLGSGVHNTLEVTATFKGVPEPCASFSFVVGLGLLAARALKLRSVRRLG